MSFHGELICASKFRYNSKYSAMLHLKRREKRRERIKQKHAHGHLRPYRCPHCHGWHLTSQAPRGKD